MKNKSDIIKSKKKPAKVLAVDLFAFQPQITIQEVANKIGVSKKTVMMWHVELVSYHR